MAVRKVMVSLVDCQPSGVWWTGQLDWTPPDSTGLQSGCFEWFSNGYGWPLSLVESGGVCWSPTGLCGGEIRTRFRDNKRREYMTTDFDTYLKTCGIVREHSVRNRP